MAQYIDTSYIRSEIRLMVDPLLMKLREELMGSGVSFGRISPGAMPTTVITVDGGGDTTDITSYGFITGITTYSGGTLVATNQKELSFVNASVTTAGNRTTVTIPLGLTNPMTSVGDIIKGGTSGTPERLAIGTSGYLLRSNGTTPVWYPGIPDTISGDILYNNGSALVALNIGATDEILTISGGFPRWSPAAAGFTNPMTTSGDMIYHSGSNPAERLPIGTSGQVLTVSGNLPIWKNISTLAIPRQVAWYEDGTLTVANSKGPLRRLDANVTLTNAYIYVKTAPTGASLIVDIKKATSPDGTYTTIFSSAPSISASAFVGSSTSFSTPNLSAGDYLRMDITQIGSTVAGASLTVDLNMVTR